MNAVDAARVFYRKNIALFAEVPVEHPELPGIGHIGGNIDFLASTVAGDEDMREDAEYALPEKPYFIVVNAKKSSTLGQHSSKAQLLAELLTLDHLDGYKYTNVILISLKRTGRTNGVIDRREFLGFPLY